MVQNRQAYDAYKKFTQNQPCHVCGTFAETSHIDTIGAHGDNYYCVPHCRICHTIFHSHGRKQFEERFRVNLMKVAMENLIAFIELTLGGKE